MVNSNQRSIYEGIQKVVGSSNRGFLSLDPERQPRIVTQPKSGAAASAQAAFQAPQAGRSTSPSGAGSGRR